MWISRKLFYDVEIILCRYIIVYPIVIHFRALYRRDFILRIKLNFLLNNCNRNTAIRLRTNVEVLEINLYDHIINSANISYGTH